MSWQMCYVPVSHVADLKTIRDYDKWGVSWVSARKKCVRRRWSLHRWSLHCCLVIVSAPAETTCSWSDLGGNNFKSWSAILDFFVTELCVCVLITDPRVDCFHNTWIIYSCQRVLQARVPYMASHVLYIRYIYIYIQYVHVFIIVCMFIIYVLYKNEYLDVFVWIFRCVPMNIQMCLYECA